MFRILREYRVLTATSIITVLSMSCESIGSCFRNGAAVCVFMMSLFATLEAYCITFPAIVLPFRIELNLFEQIAFLSSDNLYKL